MLLTSFAAQVGVTFPDHGEVLRGATGSGRADDEGRHDRCWVWLLS